MSSSACAAAGLLRRAKNSAEREMQQQQKRVKPVLQLCREVVAALLDKTIPDAQVRVEIIERYSEERLQALSEECETLGQPVDHLYINELRQRYGYARRFAPRLLESFILQTTFTDKPVLKAIEYLRECNNKTREFDHTSEAGNPRQPVSRLAFGEIDDAEICTRIEKKNSTDAAATPPSGFIARGTWTWTLIGIVTRAPTSGRAPE